MPAFEYASLPLPYTKWLIPDYLPSAGVVLLQGAAFAGKSFLALQMADAVHSGSEFLGHKTHRSDVLYIMLEAEFAWHSRLKDLAEVGVGLDFHVPNPHARPKTIDIASPQAWEWFSESIKSLNPRLVIIDPIRELGTHDENDSMEMKKLFGIIEPVLHNRCVMFIHHERKSPSGMSGPTTDSASNAGRGTYLPGKADVLLWLQGWSEGKRGKLSIESRYTGHKEHKLKRQESGLWELA